MADDMPPAASPTLPPSTTEATNARMLNDVMGKVLTTLGAGSAAVAGVLTEIANAITSSIIGGTTGVNAERILVSKGTGGFALEPTAASVDPATGNISTPGDLAAATLSSPLATTALVGGVELASDAEIRSAATGSLAVSAAAIESASAGVALTDAATVAVNWDAGINFTLTVTASRIIGNPTNGQPGTWRTILVQGNDATDRTITFDTQYLGDVPTITNADSTRWFLLMIYCVSASHFVVSSKRALGTA
jgi:hypothetical protein